MPSIVPNRFLVRFCHPVPYHKAMPLSGSHVVQLPESARLDNFASLDDLQNFADLIMAADRDPVSVAYIDHVYEAREGARGALGGSGGGCGCN